MLPSKPSLSPSSISDLKLVENMPKNQLKSMFGNLGLRMQVLIRISVDWTDFWSEIGGFWRWRVAGTLPWHLDLIHQVNHI